MVDRTQTVQAKFQDALAAFRDLVQGLEEEIVQLKAKCSLLEDENRTLKEQRAARKDLKLPKSKRRKYEESPLNETADAEQLNRNNNNKGRLSSSKSSGSTWCAPKSTQNANSTDLLRNSSRAASPVFSNVVFNDCGSVQKNNSHPTTRESKSRLHLQSPSLISDDDEDLNACFVVSSPTNIGDGRTADTIGSPVGRGSVPIIASESTSTQVQGYRDRVVNHDAVFKQASATTLVNSAVVVNQSVTSEQKTETTSANSNSTYDGVWLSAVKGSKSGVRSSSLGIKPHVVSSKPELASIDLTKNDVVADSEANCGINFEPNAAATQLDSTSSVTTTAAAARHSALSRFRLSHSHTSQLLAAGKRRRRTTAHFVQTKLSPSMFMNRLPVTAKETVEKENLAPTNACIGNVDELLPLSTTIISTAAAVDHDMSQTLQTVTLVNKRDCNNKTVNIESSIECAMAAGGNVEVVADSEQVQDSVNSQQQQPCWSAILAPIATHHNHLLNHSIDPRAHFTEFETSPLDSLQQSINILGGGVGGHVTDNAAVEEHADSLRCIDNDNRGVDLDLTCYVPARTTFPAVAAAAVSNDDEAAVAIATDTQMPQRPQEVDDRGEDDRYDEYKNDDYGGEADYDDDYEEEVDYDESNAAVEDGPDAFADGLGDSFDRVPVKSTGPKYAHVQVVRKQADRAKLQSHACQDCMEYFKGLGLTGAELEQRMRHCRHKAKYALPSTPAHYWSVGFMDTQAAGMHTTQVAPSKYRRKRRLKNLFDVELNDEL